MTKYEPHPHALLLPPLTEAEYEALKADIAEHGILYPVILDEDDRILDGVHRVRIAEELGIDPPATRHTGLDEERKLHLAVGLNMRRRHLDADRRRDLVRSLSDDQGLSIRQIASVTGWSKSTVHRDLQASPFEHFIARAAEAQEGVANLESAPQGVRSAIAELFGAWREGFSWADNAWKQDAWPPPPVEHLLFTFQIAEIRNAFKRMEAAIQERDIPDPFPDWRPKWDSKTDEEREAMALEARDRGLLLFSVPDGTGE